MPVERQRQILRQLIDKYTDEEFDTNSIDLDAWIDSTLTFSENKDNIFDRFLITEGEPTQEEIEEAEHQLKQREEHYMKQKQKEELSHVKGSTNKHYRKIKDVIHVMKNADNLHLLYLYGEAGWGKTSSVRAMINELGYEEAVEEEEATTNSYHIISGKTTYLEFIKEVYEFADCAYIICDDLYGLLENKGMVNILKDATDTIAEHRYVRNRTKTDKNYTLPNTFHINAKLIVISNQQPQDDADINALLNRGRVINLTFDLETKYTILDNIAHEQQIPNEVVDYIKENTTEASRFSIRTLLRGYEYYQHLQNWREHISDEIEAREIEGIVYEIAHNYPTTKEQVQEFKERTGRSRATYFRIKKKLGLSQ